MKQWFGLNEENEKAFKSSVGSMRTIVFLKNAFVDQGDLSIEDAHSIIIGLLNEVFGQDKVTGRNRPSANDPRIILDWSNEEVCNYFFKAFVRITSKTTFEVDRETTLFFSDQTQIHMTLFDSSADKDDGFDTSSLFQGKVFEVGPKDMYIDIHGLPHTYKYDRMIGNTISSQMGNYLCPVLRKGAYYWRTMTYSKVPKWGENPGEQIPLLQEDGESFQKQDICRQYFTNESYCRMLFHVFYKKEFRLPTYLVFSNGDCSEPYELKWTLMNTKTYTIPAHLTASLGEIKIKVCANCKEMDCQPDSDTCKARKSSVTKPMKQYHDKKAKKTEIYEDLRAKAKRKREELQTSITSSLHLPRPKRNYEKR